MTVRRLQVVTVAMLMIPIASHAPWCAEGVSSIDHAFNMRTLIGALVVEVEPGGSAAMAGISAGDVLGSMDGQTVHDLRTLDAHVGALRESAMLKGAVTEVWRLDRTSGSMNLTTLNLRLPAQVGERFGMVLIPVLFVREVGVGSAAESAGIRAWDSIEKVGNQRIADISQFDDIEQLVLTQRTERGVRLTVGHWKPSPSRDRKQVLEGLRELTLPIATN